MKLRPTALMIFRLLIGTGGAAAVEHPGVLDKNEDCLSCHASKAMGKSVHSAMANPCTICHLAQTQADMTTLTLIMPTEQICFACHEKSGELQKHTPVVQGGAWSVTIRTAASAGCCCGTRAIAQIVTARCFPHTQTTGVQWRRDHSCEVKGAN